MKDEEMIRFFSEFDDDLEFDDYDGEYDVLSELLNTRGLTRKQAEKKYADFILWFEAMKKLLDVSEMQKAVFCRRLCSAVKNDFSEDHVRLWCLCMSEYSDFLFEAQGDIRDRDYADYRLFQFLKLSEDTENYIRRIISDAANAAEFKRISENIAFSDKPIYDINADLISSEIKEIYDISGEQFEDNVRYVCGRISQSEELMKISPNVLYALFTRCRKKMTEKEGYAPDFKKILRYAKYNIHIDNGKNQRIYEEHLLLYESLCGYFDNISKPLCDMGFACMSNICENENIQWDKYANFERPLETELKGRYFSCFPGGLNDNPVFAANEPEIDIDDIVAFEDFYDAKLPPKCRILDKTRVYLNENADISERYISLLERRETDKCFEIIHDIIEHSEIDPAFIKPDMVDITNAVIMEEVHGNVSSRIKDELLELLPCLRENLIR